jgi:alpha-L-fucosidase 2
LQEWLQDYKETEPEHRHTSHLMALYPLQEITPWSTPELAAACRETLKRRNKGGTGWAWAWRMALWARMQGGDEALGFLRSFLTPSSAMDIDYNNGAGTYPNLFCAGPPFQIDGNLGSVAAIAEMFMQSHGEGNVIRLLPALPSDASLQSGQVKGLRARNGFDVSFDWKDGKVQHITITSKSGLPCHIITGGKVTIKDKNGKLVNYRQKGDAIVFNTTLNNTYSILL